MPGPASHNDILRCLLMNIMTLHLIQIRKSNFAETVMKKKIFFFSRVMQMIVCIREQLPNRRGLSPAVQHLNINITINLSTGLYRHHWIYLIQTYKIIFLLYS